MRIAVTYENGNVFQHFGRTPGFKFYDVTDGQITSSQVVSAGGAGHGALVGVLANSGVDTLICGGLGGGALNGLAQAGIKVYAGATGPVDEAVANFLAGNMQLTADASCDCHDHEHEQGGAQEQGCGCRD